MELLKDLEAENPLWRYMDTSKFLDLLLHKKLVLPRFDKFEDPYEGYASNFVELLRKHLRKESFEESGTYYGGRIFADSVNISNHYAYVSCWHHNEHESAGMWKLYCSTPESIAVKTNVGSLKQALNSNSNYQLIFSKVTYDSKLDGYEINDLHNVNVFNSLLMKRESFEHEKEYRLILVDNADRLDQLARHHQNNDQILNDIDNRVNEEIKNNFENLIGNFNKRSDIEDYLTNKMLEELKAQDTGVTNVIKGLKITREVIKTLDIDLDILVDEIVVSPYAPSWFVRTIEKLVYQLGYSFKVTQSKLYELN